MKILITSFLPDCQNQIAASFLKSFKSDLDIFISGTNCMYESSSLIFRLIEESFLQHTFEQIAYITTSRNTYFDHHIFIAVNHIPTRIDNEVRSKNKQTYEILLPEIYSGSKELNLETYRQLRDLLKNEMFIFFKSL
jgi:hypothetical protein